MLKITAHDDGDSDIVLNLQGRLGGPWVAELERACEAARATGGRLTLDLAGVSFVDGEGTLLVQRLVAWPVSLRNCSPFVAEQLRGIARCVPLDRGSGVGL